MMIIEIGDQLTDTTGCTYFLVILSSPESFFLFRLLSSELVTSLEERDEQVFCSMLSSSDTRGFVLPPSVACNICDDSI
jgi:hypothetical protein